MDCQAKNQPHMSGQFFWAPFLTFAVINSFTPGPNVIMLASSGGVFGIRKTLPHLFGVCCGLPLMLLLVVFGSSEVFKKFPWMLTLLTIVSLAYVALLALRIYRMGFKERLSFNSQVRPMSFLEATLYQWVNGKAWQIVLMVATLYSVESSSARFSQAGIIWIVTFAAGIVWIELGKRIAGFLEKPFARRVYYSLLALALILSTFPKGLEHLFSI
jgi:threonine/homoserine/homoserine lactone efflux protein